MGKSSKKDKKSKDKQKKSKRKHEYSSDSESADSDEHQRKRAKAERLAQRVASHLKKHSQPAQQENGEGTVAAGRFVWHKKIEKQLLGGAKVQDLTAKAEARRQRERMEEIEKVQKRREERERERAAMEEEHALLQRQRALAEARELETKEEEFHLDQAIRRSQQRLREGRAKAIDMLVKNLYLTADFDVDAAEPYHVFRGLMLHDVRELRDDIDAFQELDNKDPDHVAFWKAMVVVADHELADAEYQEQVDQARVKGLQPPPPPRGHTRGLHKSVERDVQMMLSGKTMRELDELEEGIEQQLRSGDAADPEYWTAVLDGLTIHKAKARLREIHRSLLQHHILQLKSGERIDVAKEMHWDEEEQAAEVATEEQPNVAAEAFLSKHSNGDAAEGDDGEEAAEEAAAGEGAWQGDSEEDEAVEEENHGQWSPEALPYEQVAGQEIINQEEDEAKLELLRAQVRAQEASSLYHVAARGIAAGPSGDQDLAYREMLERSSAGIHPMMRNLTDAAPQAGELAIRSGRHAVEVDDAQTRQFKAASSKVMGDLNDMGDAPFTGDVALESQVYWWHEKYKPRKPKYFNRVHTGYEWNKYNQTHYDSDNPPPKVVQGYKFNIFYPDLIDKVKAPEYKTEKDPSSKDGSTCLLRFRAGPPYEDIAFRIVNKEWEYSHKKGFKSSFERGILHLYFNFKRTKYRR